MELDGITAGGGGATWTRSQTDTRGGGGKARTASQTVVNIISSPSQLAPVLLRPGSPPIKKNEVGMTVNREERPADDRSMTPVSTRVSVPASSVGSGRNAEISPRLSSGPGFSLTSAAICISQVNEISIFMAFRRLPLTLGSSGTGRAGDTDVN